MENEAVASLISWSPIILMAFIFYFLLYRPQQQMRKSRDEMLGSIKVGCEVVTVGGIYGKVTELYNEHLMLKIADNVEIKVVRGAINSIVPEDAKDEGDK